MSADVDLTEISPETVREISRRLDEPDWLLEQRLDALEALPELDLPPVIQTPGRRWTNLTNLDFDTLVDPLNAAEEKDQTGPSDVSVLPLSDAVQEHPELLREHFGTVIDPTEHYFTALSTALFTTGTVVHIPEGVSVDDVKIRTTMNSRSLFNYTLVVSETSSEVTILERQSTGTDLDQDRYYSGIVEVVAGPNSTVQYGSLQELSDDTYTYTLKRASADRDANVTWIEANLGSRLTKSSVETSLDGEGSATKIIGAFFGYEDQHMDVASRVWHRNQHTTADLVTRGVLDDEARSVYEGVQHVGKEAWHTNSYQRENTLMLSDESEADASPKLIINNHETEASHSATVGQIDAQDLFYMTSRGIPERLAKNMLVEGFFVPVLEEIAVDEFRADLEAQILERLRS